MKHDKQHERGLGQYTGVTPPDSAVSGKNRTRNRLTREQERAQENNQPGTRAPGANPVQRGDPTQGEEGVVAETSMIPAGRSAHSGDRADSGKFWAGGGTARKEDLRRSHGGSWREREGGDLRKNKSRADGGVSLEP